MKRALVTGITGQDGRHLADLLTAKGYQVFGLIRGQANPKAEMILDENPALELVDGDLRDLSSLIAAVEQVQPDEVYNLGAISFVQLSFKQAELTAEITGLGVLRMIEAVRIVGGTDNNPIRFYQASSSEMFGKVREVPQRESTPFYPRSPYGVSKVFAHYITVNYRESYQMFAVSGILFNHESPRRGLEFVTRRISDGVARISLGMESELRLGNLDALRDWGYAGDYVKAMWLMLQLDKPEDFVIATGITTPVREFIRMAFKEAGIEIEFKGEGLNETGIVTACHIPESKLAKGTVVVRIDPRYFEHFGMPEERQSRISRAASAGFFSSRWARPSAKWSEALKPPRAARGDVRIWVMR